jgi:NADH dehydrogenase/NADH:ubiquinone oxidoreductase subunit G
LPTKTISVRIDGELVTAQEGQSILEAARANGKQIPTLCYLKGLSAVGACRVCIVELAGTDRLLPADGGRAFAGGAQPHLLGMRIQ